MQEAVNDSLSGGERRGTSRRCGVIEFFADLPANLEQPFDLLLHRGRFSPLQLRWVSFQRYDGGNVRHQLSSRRKYAVKLSPAKVLAAGNRPELTARQIADFGCPDTFAASLRFNIGSPSLQVICRATCQSRINGF